MSTLRSHLEMSMLAASLSVAAFSLQGQDVTFVGVVKGVSHWQSGPSTPGLAAQPHQFNAFANLSNPGRLTEALLTPPGKPSVSLQAEGGSWELAAEFGTSAELEAAFPNGNYTIRLTAVTDGLRTITLPLTGDAYPPIPTLNGFNSLQGIPAQADFTVTWAPFTGGTLFDFIQFSVHRANGEEEETVFESAQPGQPGALNGTQTSLTLPAGTLAPGQNYFGRLLFAKIVAVDATSYGQGVPAIAAYFRETRVPLAAQGNQDTQPPVLWRTSPGAGDGAVPRNSAIAFEFSEPMQAGQTIAWTGLDPARLTYHWSENGRVLFCTYAPQLPALATITWKVQRSGFRDVAGNSLPQDSQGSFVTAAADTLATPDVTFAGLFKSEQFIQAPGGIPQRPAQGGYRAGAFAKFSAYNSALAGNLRLPGGNTVPFENAFGESMELETAADSKSAQDQAAPTGHYQLTLETVHQGVQSVSLVVPSDAYPSIPEFLNLAAAEGLDTAHAFMLSWKPMTGGLVSDFIGLGIEPEAGGEALFETPDFDTGQNLNGSATSVTIPAGTLKPGRTYRANLEFAHPVSLDAVSIPGATVVVAYTRVTEATFTTGGIPSAPVLTLRPAPDGRWILRISGDAGVNYVLEAAAALGSTWSSLSSFQMPGEPLEFSDGALGEHRFYRVREGF